MNGPDTAAGLVVVAKPAGLTSHDVVARLRRLLGTRRIGHAGTLDPMATGVLVCGVHRATKLLGYLPLEPKVYRATVRLGESTSTDDAQGERTGGADPSALDVPAIRAGIAALTGTIDQVPSSVSAVKVDGRRAYALVREGRPVALAPRPVTVSRFDLLAMRTVAGADGAALLDLDVLVECSAGTYVRALARDLGEALGVGGHLTALRRTAVGPFALDSARSLAELAERPQVTVGLDDAVFAAFARRPVDAEQARVLAHGGRLPAAGLSGTSAAVGPDGRAVALLTEEGPLARPVLVLRPAGGS